MKHVTILSKERPCGAAAGTCVTFPVNQYASKLHAFKGLLGYEEVETEVIGIVQMCK